MKLMKNLLWIALFSLASIFSYSQQQIKITSCQAAGILEDRIQWLDTLIMGYIDRDELNGAVALVAHEGEIGYFKAFGYKNVEQQVPMHKDDIFRLASMTKPVVCVALMMLFEEGRFMLDDPISKFIPEFKNPVILDKFNFEDTTYTTIPAKREITFRHLLTHTSGIGYAQIGSKEANAMYNKYHIIAGIGDPYHTLDEIIPRLGHLPLFNQPGEAFLYGLNVDVIGYLVEVISGISLDKFLQKRIFEPLEMKDTYFYLPDDKKYRLVPLYKIPTGGKLEIQDSIVQQSGRLITDYPKLKGQYFSGGAGLSSTAHDYYLFCQMLLNEGTYNEKRILSPVTVRMMTSNQIGDILMYGQVHKPSRFGLGFGIFSKYYENTTGISEGSYEWSGMFASHFWIDPVENVVVVIMRNIWPTPHWDLGDRVKPVIYQALDTISRN